MKLLFLLFISFYISACTSSADSHPTKNGVQKANAIQNPALPLSGQGQTDQNQNPLKFQYYLDSQSGLIQSRSPLPSNWLMHQGTDAPYYITGPNGIKVNQPQMEMYTYSQDPYTLQTIQMSGKEIAPVYSLEQILEQHIRPSAQAQGYSYVESYPIPGVQAFWEKLAAGSLQTGSRRSIYTLGSEWKDNQGNHSLITLVQMVIEKESIITWTLLTTELEAPAREFPQAKQAYLYGVAHTEINPQWQQYKNGELMGQLRRNDAFWAQANAQSAQAHQQRMAAIQARGNASQSLAQTYSEISDISHAGYLNRSNMVSAGQSKTVNMIGGHAIISNSNTSEQYQVEAGSKYYWVNKDGEYFGTDNSLYDPRIDNRINGEQWEKFQIEQ